MKLAVVGAGPKALFCLERLAFEISQRPVPELELQIFEPHPYPGAGPNYDPTQPEVLRMNLANRAIDLWPPHDATRPAGARTYIEFEADADRTAAPHAYAPRASVGRYLADGFDRVVGGLRHSGSVHVVEKAVTGIDRSGAGFELRTSTTDFEVDEVLIATGHSSQLNRTLGHPSSAVYPITRSGGVLDIANDSYVTIRGMGLTAIDAVLSLTEGRGGAFHDRPNHAYEYRRAPDSIDHITIESRTNRPMVPKPTRSVELSEDRHGHIWSDARAQIIGLGQSHTPVDDLRRILVSAADSVLRTMDIDGPPAADELERHLARQTLSADAAAATLRLYTDVAYGRREATAPTMLGTTWRRCYPAIVDLVALRALDTPWPAFSKIATEMEPLAFGPPPDTAARLCALLDAGVLSVGGARTEQPEPSAGHVHYDAVLDAPGIVPSPSPLIASLLDAGLATRRADTSGLAIAPDGTCVGRDGGLTTGLSAVGRPTEGSVLGNDTLDRRLHDLPACWAAAIVSRHSNRQERP